MGNKLCCLNNHRQRNTPTYVPQLPLNKSSEIPSIDIQQIYIDELFLPSYYNTEILTENLQHEQECAICFEPFYQRDIIARLECLCIYHKRCLDQWNQRKRCCPLHMDKALLTTNHEELSNSGRL